MYTLISSKGFLLLFLGCLGITLTGVLFTFSKKINRQGNFIRLLPSHSLKDMRALDLGFNSYYIAGATSSGVYLGNNTAHKHLLFTNYSLTDTHHLLIKLMANREENNSGGNKMRIDSPNIYTTNALNNTITYGRLFETKYYQRTLNSRNIGLAMPISPSSTIIKKYDSELALNVLTKETIDNSLNRTNRQILKKQLDGFFCTDGLMVYNYQKNYVVYVYYYRNEFMVIDTNLNMVMRANTIDTNTVAKIKIANLSFNQATLLSSPLVVNKFSSSYHENLYILSGLVSKNEVKSIYNYGSAVDIYSLKGGEYLKSFYLPDYKGESIKDFQVYSDKVIAIAGRYLLTFKLNL